MEMENKILDQTFLLVMRYGIKSVSMDDISKGIGISKKTIYQYFENKKTLITNVMVNHIEKDKNDLTTITAKSINAIDEMVGIAKHVMQFLRGMSPSLMYDIQKYYPGVWTKVEKEHFDFLKQTVTKNIERGQSEGIYNVDLNADVVSKLYVKQSLALADQSFFPLSEYSRIDLFKNMVTYHIRGLMNDNGRNIAQELEID